MISFNVRRPGTETRFSYRLQAREVFVGRGESAHVRLPDASVSLVHLRVTRRGNIIEVVDLDSVNGTRLNGEPLAARQAVPVELGAKLHVGPFVLELVRSAEGEAPTAPQDTASYARQMVRELALGGARPRLVVENGPRIATEVPIDVGELRIGRADENELSLPDEDASRLHAQVICEAGEFWIVDLSKNGVQLNGVRVQERARLHPSDQLKIGQTLVRFVDPSDAALERLATNTDASAAATAPQDDASAPAPVPVPAQAPAAPERALLLAAVFFVMLGIAAVAYLFL